MKARMREADTTAVVDAKTCEAWLSRAALADPRHACQELTALLESLEESPPADADYLDVLERLREPIAITLAEHAKKITGRPLPLRDHEAGTFDQLQDLWSAFGRAYRRLLRHVESAEPGALPHQAPLIAQRALDCTVELMTAHYRCRREVDFELWRELHRLYRSADDAGHAHENIPASLRSKTITSCHEVYVRALLLPLANPYALGGRELGWTRRWATTWAHKVDLVSAAADAQGYAVDLAGDQPPAWIRAEQARDTTRFLETSQLRRSVKGRLRKLDAGVDPHTLGLGKDCVQPDVGRLLATLSRGWLEPPAARQFTRRATPGRVELVCGFDAIHAALTGKSFRSASRHWDYSRRDAEALSVYQSTSVGNVDAPPAVPTERWESLDESANGFRLRRDHDGARLAHLQLVALKPQDARRFILSEVRWLMAGVDRALVIGAAALPGLAAGIAMRPVGNPTLPEPYTQAFLLPAAPGHAESLVVPAGWHQPGRELELKVDDELVRAQLGAVLQRGYDFDRVAFSRA
jgi:hypothetical protein